MDNEGKTATWEYYTNDERKARWKCSLCGKICRKDPREKRYCSNCGARMVKGADDRISCM